MCSVGKDSSPGLRRWRWWAIPMREVYDPEPHGGTVRRASGEDGHGKRYAVRHIGDQRP